MFNFSNENQATKEITHKKSIKLDKNHLYNEEAPEDDYTSIKHIQVKDTLTVNHHIDEDSIRRHEMDRGSDIEYERRASFKRQHACEDGNNNAREQLFIRDGNTEILRLVTRGNLDNSNENLYINVPVQQKHNCHANSPQYVLVEGSGKEILMRRFIEEQANGKQIIREHYRIVPDKSSGQTLPNEVLESDNEKREMEKQKKMNLVETELAQATSHQSLVIQHELENSLKQQNALLRQILLEKERLEEKYREHENALETQSLPCHSVQAAAQTQTDCEIAVQTDPYNLEMNGSRTSLFRRRTRSENDDSASEEDYEYVRYSPPNSPNGIYWIKRRRHRKKSKGPKDQQMSGPRKVVTVESVKRKIRTPIQEESEDKNKRKDKTSHKETRASNLRRAKIASDRHRMIQEKLYYDLNDSMDEGEIVPNIKTKSQKTIKYFIEDSDGSENEIIMHKNYYSADSLDIDYEMDEPLNEDERRRMTESVPPTPAIRRGIMKDKNRKQNQFKSFEVEYASSPEKLLKGSRPVMNDRQKTYNKMTYEMPNTKAVPRYMEWYAKGKEGDSPRSQPPPKAKRKSKESQEPKPEPLPRNTPSKEAARLLKEDLEMAKKIESRTHLPDPLSHPLLQHSEHRFEHEYSPQPHIPKPPTKLPHYMYPNTPPTNVGDQKINIKTYKPNAAPINENEVSKTTTTIKIPIEHNGFSNPNITTTSTTVTKMMNANNVQQHHHQQHQQHYEDDHDSGIAMNSLLHGKRNKMAEKKSVFTIAYDDVQIKRIQMNENEDLSPVN